MDRLRFSALVTLALVAAFGVANAVPQEAPQKPQEQTSLPSVDTAAGQSDTGKPFETFAPTEEISEDLPVAFPKDI